MTSVLFPTLSPAQATDLLARCEDDAVLFADAHLAATAVRDSSPDRRLLERFRGTPFLGLIARVIQAPWVGLQQRAAAEHLADPAALINEVTADIIGHLHTLCCRPLSAEMRSRSQRGELLGSTPEERYDYFQQLLLDPSFFSTIDRAYPMLVPTMAEAAQQRFAHVEALLSHLSADADALRSVGLLPALVRSVQMGSGDPHRRGQSVAVLTLIDESKLVYKPRSLGVDAGLARTIEHLNHLAGTTLPTLRTLNRGTHGWMEFVDAALPTGESAEEQHYEQIGQLLALLTMLGATDMHYENVIASAQGPVVIDGETVLHPRLSAAPGVPGTNAETILRDSVHAIGLLPLVITSHGQGVDVGAVGYSGGALSPFKSLVERNPGRDDLAYALESRPMPAVTAPSLPSGTIRVLVIIEAICAGFTTAARALIRDGEAIAAKLPEYFAGAEVRYLANPTAHYAQLLRLVTHQHFYLGPEFRRQGIARVALAQPSGSPFTAAECRDLARGDVPLFVADANGHRLVSVDGDVVADLPVSPVGSAQDRLRALTEEVLEAHLQHIRAAFIARFPEPKPVPLSRVPDRSSTDAALGLAVDVGERLLSSAAPSAEPGGPARWLGPLLDNDDSGWQPGILPDDLYTGISGPALFLASLAAVDGRKKWADGARAVFDPMASQLADGLLHDSARKLGRLGVYTGVGGLHWVLAEAGTLMGENQWREVAFAELGRLEHLVRNGYDRPDHIDGLSGLVMMALRLRTLAGTHQQRTKAEGLAALCVQALEATHEACSLTQSAPVYSGFAHGLAGMSAALRLAGQVGVPVTARVETELADGLRAMYDRSVHNWWSSHERDRHGSAWCHGAPGIALGPVLDAEQGLAPAADAEEVLRVGAGSILAHGIGRSSTWCHGDPGNVDTLRRIATLLDDGDLIRQSEQFESALISDLLPRWLDDPYNRYRYTPNALLGTSGSGWFALRTLEPRIVPHLLSIV